MQGFGYKTAWLAIRHGSADAVFAALGCRNAGPVGWLDGVDLAYGDQDVALATPALADGWMLVMGRRIMAVADVLDVATISAALHTEVQLFVSHRVVDLHRWERGVDGSLLRSFEYLGERGEVTRWYGTPDDI